MPHPDALRVARFMEAIPRQDEEPMSIDKLSAAADVSVETASALVALLDSSGSLTIAPGATAAGGYVRAANAASAFYLRSLAQYVRDGSRILVNWERPGTVAGPYSENEVLSGPQFLYLMERQRLARNPNAVPLRKAEIAQVLIKCRVRGRGKAQYLAQYDNAARQFQLLGGHRRTEDTDLRETAVRELEEELTGFSFDPTQDSLVELGHAQVVQLSRTYGVSTLYELKLFQLRSVRSGISPSPGARWLTEDELIRDQSGNLNFTGLRRIAETIPGGVANLPLSLQSAQQKSWRAIIGENSWAFWGIMVGVVGVILTVIFFFLS